MRCSICNFEMREDGKHICAGSRPLSNLPLAQELNALRHPARQPEPDYAAFGRAVVSIMRLWGYPPNREAVDPIAALHRMASEFGIDLAKKDRGRLRQGAPAMSSEPIRLTEEERMELLDALRGSHSLMGHMELFETIARRVLAAQESDERPTVADIVKELKTIHGSCHHVDARERFGCLVEILVAAAEFMREAENSSLPQAASDLYAKLRKLVKEA